MNATSTSAWQLLEAGFVSEGERLFYRAWQPLQERSPSERRALIFLHRGHEHSGRIAPLVAQLGYEHDWAFAWDARGHGYSPGERGDAPDFGSLVRDLDNFIQHLATTFQIKPENMLLVANSVGAVVASTWLHDYAVPVRGLIMAAAAFDINLYVPLAKPALHFATKFKPDLFVTSYIRSSMLTHCPEQAELYDSDPLIAKAISARVLLDLAETAKRIVHDAAAIDTPILMLVAGRDLVVKTAPQLLFFQRLSSPLKRLVVLPDSFHAILYEADMQTPLHAMHDFIDDCFSLPLPAHPLLPHSLTLASHASGQSPLIPFWKKAAYIFQRLLLQKLGRLSCGMRIGLEHGFDSGKSLDYVYRNQPQGRLLIGKWIDSGYLQAIGWRGIRQRKIDLQHSLIALIEQFPAERPIRILDVAAGSGRYVLEILKRYQERPFELTLRDFQQQNLDDAQQLALSLGLQSPVHYEQRDAFAPESYPTLDQSFDIVIVSGLYELFSDNRLIDRSLQGIRQQIAPGGYLVYTGQPWHPQLELIANTLNNHLGQPWVMRPRSQGEMDALVRNSGGRKVSTRIGTKGIFTVSVAQF